MQAPSHDTYDAVPMPRFVLLAPHPTAVLTSPAASEECPETFDCSDPTMPTSCGLYPNTARGNWDPDYQCNRLYSRSLDYVLVLHTNGDLVVYFTAGPDSTEQPSEVVWSGDTSIGFEARRLVLTSDGSWALNSENGPNSNVVLANDVGFLNPWNGGGDLGPFTLYVSDDGGVWLVNSVDDVAWSTRSTGPPENVPPPSPVACRPGSVYSAAHGQCVWGKLGCGRRWWPCRKGQEGSARRTACVPGGGHHQLFSVLE